MHLNIGEFLYLIMRKDRENIIVEQTFRFGLNGVQYAEVLEDKRKYVMADQLFRSGTLVGANVRGAQNAESKADFMHKMKIAAKEADETYYWLDLHKNSRQYPDPGDMLTDISVIGEILSKIIVTSKSR